MEREQEKTTEIQWANANRTLRILGEPHRVMSESERQASKMETRATAVQLPAVHIPLLLCCLS